MEFLDGENYAKLICAGSWQRELGKVNLRGLEHLFNGKNNAKV